MISNMQSVGSKSGQTKYPELLRMGHRFETSVGQRHAVYGFKAAMDFAFGGDGLLYILNRQQVAGDAVPRIRIVVLNSDDEFQRNIEPSRNGLSDASLEKNYSSPVFCQFMIQLIFPC